LDESIQKQIEDSLAKHPEHWVWIDGQCTGPRCKYCDRDYPQSRERCFVNHQHEGGRMILDPTPR
jgi:hypothetical protein